jgi:hypothetical protein
MACSRARSEIGDRRDKRSRTVRAGTTLHASSYLLSSCFPSRFATRPIMINPFDQLSAMCASLNKFTGVSETPPSADSC